MEAPSSPARPAAVRRRVRRLIWLAALSAGATSLWAQVEPPFYENRGVVGLAQALRRVEVGLRVLHVGAHPDDEDSALLAYLSLGRGARVWYLSLTRGEGGQNAIGPELSEDLGVLRSAELLAARRDDGAYQLFGRMIDFGFSKSAEEALDRWGREEVLRDVVRVIRLTRPHIVISRFQGTPRDGHGQHQAAGWAAAEAIAAAADPERFPDLAAEGLRPWRVQKYYVGTFQAGPEVTLTLDTSRYDPWIGRSVGAVGYRGRSRHRSQDMGMIEFENSRPSHLIRREPPPSAPESDLFEGVQPDALGLDPSPGALLRRPDLLTNPSVLAPDLVRLIERARAAGADPWALGDLEAALGEALGLRLEALAERPHVILGGEVNVVCAAYLPEPSALERARWSLLPAVQGLRVEPPGAADPSEGSDAPGRGRFRIVAGPRATPSLPYYLRQPPDGDRYGWPEGREAASPFGSPAVVARLEARVEGVAVGWSVPVEHRRAAPTRGEIRSELEILPPISVRFDPPWLLVPKKAWFGHRFPVETEVVNLSDQPLTGSLIGVWLAHPSLVEAGSSSVVLPPERALRLELNLTIPAGLGEPRPAQGQRDSDPTPPDLWAAHWLEAPIAGTEGGASRVDRIDYAHIRPRSLVRPAELRLHRLAVTVPEGLKVGYLPGSGDEVAVALAQLGVEVIELDEAVLARPGLADLDAIVLGVRAYEARPGLKDLNPRLLDYVNAGGTLLVQYNRYPFETMGAAPWPMAFARPHDRVTNPAAPVTILEPAHPVFHFPHEIVESDFEGWVQERGLYFWSRWDDAYRPLLACADAGEEAKAGGLLVARLGRGHYIYTGYAFFRQLPAGVNGAARLLVNLISLRRASAPTREEAP